VSIILALKFSFKLPKSAVHIATSFVLSIFMTGVISAISTVRNIGFDASFFEMWPSAWLLSWVIAFPTLVLVLPVVKRIISAITKP